jgi:hypothetical protein
MRQLAFLYGMVCYLSFLVAFLGAVAFVGDLVPAIPVSVDRGPAAPPGAALTVDAALLALLAVQHSVIARRAFERVWTRVASPAIERSTYVLFSSLVLVLLLVEWRPVPAVVWDLENSNAVASCPSLPPTIDPSPRSSDHLGEGRYESVASTTWRVSSSRRSLENRIAVEVNA